jgi:hypothetical protein
MYDGQAGVEANLAEPFTVLPSNGVAPISGEVVVSDEIDDWGDEETNHYQVKVKIKRMTWNDNMVHARFQLLIESIGDIDGESTTKPERIAALRELIEGFGELTGFLNRVARVTCNGNRVDVGAVPMEFIEEIMDAISAARGRKASSKN